MASVRFVGGRLEVLVRFVVEADAALDLALSTVVNTGDLRAEQGFALIRELYQNEREIAPSTSFDGGKPIPHVLTDINCQIYGGTATFHVLPLAISVTRSRIALPSIELIGVQSLSSGRLTNVPERTSVTPRPLRKTDSRVCGV